MYSQGCGGSSPFFGTNRFKKMFFSISLSAHRIADFLRPYYASPEAFPGPLESGLLYGGISAILSCHPLSPGLGRNFRDSTMSS
jgi:hypothetical protein